MLNLSVHLVRLSSKTVMKPRISSSSSLSSSVVSSASCLSIHHEDEGYCTGTCVAAWGSLGNPEHVFSHGDSAALSITQLRFSLRLTRPIILTSFICAPVGEPGGEPGEDPRGDLVETRAENQEENREENPEDNRE